MNKIEPHAAAAMTFFRGGLAMMILFTLAIGLPPHDQQVLPRAYSLAGLPAILSFGGFLVLIARSMKKSRENPLSTEGVIRPGFWLLAIFEWSIFVTIILWFLVIAVGSVSYTHLPDKFLSKPASGNRGTHQATDSGHIPFANYRVGR